MKHRTFLTSDAPHVAHSTYTAHCRDCGWEALRHPLGDACTLALSHEDEPEVPAS